MDSSVAEKGDLGMTEPILKFRLSLDSAFRQQEIRNKFFGGMQIQFPFGNLKMGFFEFSVSEFWFGTKFIKGVFTFDIADIFF